MRLPHLGNVDAFVRWEEREPLRYEFVAGHVSLFPGATVRHELIVMNVGTALRAAIGPGRVRGSSLKLVTASSSRYPDLSVSVDSRETPEATSTRYPLLLVGVLSDATTAIDLGVKCDEYRFAKSLDANAASCGRRVDRLAPAACRAARLCESRYGRPVR